MSQQQIYALMEKTQGTAARIVDKLPSFVQETMVKGLGYPYVYPQLDSFTKCLMAVQHKQGYTGFLSTDINQSRKTFDHQMQGLINKPTSIAFVEDIRLSLQSGNIFARHYHPNPSKKLPMLVFYHGGGFVVGNVQTHDEVCRVIAKAANVQVLSIDYPLTPEVGPKQLIQSCEDALAWVHQNRRHFKILKNKIAVAGDSAGGNIAAVVSQRSVNKSYAPQAQFLIYPVLDFKSRHPSFYAYRDGLILTGNDTDLVTQLYATDYQISLDDPLISPTYGNLKKAPPAYIVTAGHDVLHDEGEIYSHKLRQSGVRVEYCEYSDMTHGFINFSPVSKKAKNNLIQMSKAFRKFFDKYGK